MLETIGNTPLIEARSLSAATGCRILLKNEGANPAHSVKDRPAAQIIAEAEAAGVLKPGGILVEGTGGNTGVAMALLGAAKGYRVILTMPANVSQEKVDTARALGAEVRVCPLVPFSDPRHFYHAAKAIVDETEGAVWGNQFEGLANRRAHYAGTGPEIWAQTGGNVDAFVAAAGTGGTLAGTGAFLKEASGGKVRVFLADCPGSSLSSLVRTNDVSAVAQPGGTITEGIGVNRETANFKSRPAMDGAFDVTNEETLAMCYYLLRREGIWVGPSAALNVVGAVKAARVLGPGHTVVTILCDHGSKYVSKVFNAQWLAERSMVVDPSAMEARDHADFVRAP